ncbi:C2 family cysteine protease [Myxococcota bacterium]|nr:C2 family cysteine protease [Myxococcota bacterium]
MRIRDSQFRAFVEQLQGQAAAPALGDENVLRLLASVGDTWGKKSDAVLAELSRPGITRKEQFDLASKGLDYLEKRDLRTFLDQSGWPMSAGAKNFLEALTGRAELKLDFGPLSIEGDQRDGIRGTARKGDVIEAINLTTAPEGRLHLTDTVQIGAADDAGKFVGRLPDVREGDLIRMRARGADGNVTPWVDVRAKGIEPRDNRNAKVNLERIDLTFENGAVVVTHNTPRPLSEPGAIVRFKNDRTGKTKDVTVDENGSFPKDLKLEGAAGDSFSVAVTDNVNNKDFATITGTLRVPGGQGGGVGGVDLPDPAPLKSDSREDGTARVSKERFVGPLYVGEISPGDVRQGAIGNCYFPAALAAIAHFRPEAIRDAIKKNDDGSYTVRFFQGYGRGRPVEIKIDADLYVRAWGGPLYGAAPEKATREQMELWFPLIEKAYAQWKGGYEAIGNGGISGKVMSELLGADYDYDHVDEGNAERIFRQIKQNAEAKRPMAAGTHGKDQAARYVNSGVYANHAYSVFGAVEEGGKKYVLLRNPWAQSEPGYDGKNDGVFKLELEKFARLYSSLHTVMV